MKPLLFLIFMFPFTLLAFENNDSAKMVQQGIEEQIEINKIELEKVSSKLTDINQNLETQQNINEKTINGISSQISAASYNLTIFGILFAITAIILGVYITYIERKVVKLKEENTTLLNQTKKVKNEVVEINELIQKDICGLHLKIQREETIQFLNRLSEVPEDIANLVHQLLSRELEKEDFSKVKEAYLELKKVSTEPSGLFGLGTNYREHYKLLFFQHFLDLAIKDKEIGEDLIEFYPDAISSSFRNDIIKSTRDFIKGIIDLGFESKQKEVNSFIKGISLSKYKSFEMVYEIIFKGLGNRNAHFIFFDIISDEKDSRIGKSNFGKKLKDSYSTSELSNTEKAAIEKTNAIITELEKEEQERKKLEEKKIAEAEEKKKQQKQKAAQKGKSE